MVAARAALGVMTLFLASLLVFVATEILPGNAAYAILGSSRTPQRLHALELALHLNQSVPHQYWTWISDLLRGNPGTSLASGQRVWSVVGPALGNSVILVAIAGAVGATIGVGLGIAAASRRDGWLDHGLSLVALVVVALPEFLVAITLVVVFATVVSHVLPAISDIPPGTSPLADPTALVLPVGTLVLLIVPYIFRATRSAMIEALESEYVEMANLKGLRRSRVLYVHALPNAIAPVVQVIGLSLIFLAGGIVVVEQVFNYPGVGQALFNAVTDKDVPVIQFIVIVLAAFYVVVNIVSDVVALLATPRRRLPRAG